MAKFLAPPTFCIEKYTYQVARKRTEVATESWQSEGYRLPISLQILLLCSTVLFKKYGLKGKNQVENLESEWQRKRIDYKNEI